MEHLFEKFQRTAQFGDCKDLSITARDIDLSKHLIEKHGPECRALKRRMLFNARLFMQSLIDVLVSRPMLSPLLNNRTIQVPIASLSGAMKFLSPKLKVLIRNYV